ncbi:MAG: hypothetical protein VXW65_07210 [Pseudomonadota bacterium]|nr:hypothetical protein [Pseudomonadota bacterium]
MNALTQAQALYEATVASGQNTLAKDFTFELDYFSGFYINCKEFPIPILTQKESVVVALPGGGERAINSSLQNLYDSSVSLYEKDGGKVSKVLAAIAIMPKTVRIHGWVYNGTPDHWTHRYRLRDIKFMVDTPTGDFEGQSTALMISASIKYAYFFEIERPDGQLLTPDLLLQEAGITVTAELRQILSRAVSQGVGAVVQGATNSVLGALGL